MELKRLWALAISFCMVLCMVPVGSFAAEENKDECICLIACSEKQVNKNCDICSKDYKKCEKAKQSTQEEKIGATTTTKKEEVTTKAATTTKKEEVTTKVTTKKEEVTTKATTKKEEVTTKATTKKEEVTTKATTEKEEATTKATTEKEEATTKATTEKEEATAKVMTAKAVDIIQDNGETGINVNEEIFPDETFRKWIKENISGADNEILTDEEIEAVKEINVSGKGIKNLKGIEKFTSLQKLNCSDNNLTTLDLSGLGTLQELNCSNNNLKTLNLSGLETLNKVTVGKQDGGKATVTKEEDGWKLNLKDIVGEANMDKVDIADEELPTNAEYKNGVVTFSEESIPAEMTYKYTVKTDVVMEVTLKLEKESSSDPEPEPEPTYTIKIDKKSFDFGEKCIGIQPGEQSFDIKNGSDKDVKFEVIKTKENSDYSITLDGLKEEKLESQSKVTIKINPKKGLDVGEYKENFKIKVNDVEATLVLKDSGEKLESFSASFKVVEHDEKEAWSSDNDSHWHACENCETKLEESKHEGGTANCVEKKVCDICKGSYGEVDASNHKNIKKTDAKAATHIATGNIAYWYCESCKKYFADDNGKVGKEITSASIVTAKTTTHVSDGKGWRSDANVHWQVCICGEKMNQASHTFGEVKVEQQATAEKNGTGYKSCSVCGYKKTVIIPATGTTATTAKSLLTKIIPTTGDDSHIALWLSVLVISGVTILSMLGRHLSKRK
ncbi:MAG: leucine-rich repeat domain-containing protein [Lachnospiraceae bacterium]